MRHFEAGRCTCEVSTAAGLQRRLDRGALIQPELLGAAAGSPGLGGRLGGDGAGEVWVEESGIADRRGPVRERPSGRHARWRRRRLRVDLRRWQRGRSDHRCSAPKKAEDVVPRAGCRRPQDASEAFCVQFLAAFLKRLPATPSGLRHGKVDVSELLRGGQVSHRIGVDLPSPEIARHVTHRGHADLGQEPVPLGPGCVSLVSKVDGFDYGTALPATIRRRVCSI
jgi:hypothetical protein